MAWSASPASRSGYGNVVEVDHGNGYVTRYAPQLAPDGAASATWSAPARQIAKAGSTGRSTGAHVHFEVWENGRVVNPRKFLGQNGTAPVHGGADPRLGTPKAARLA